MLCDRLIVDNIEAHKQPKRSIQAEKNNFKSIANSKGYPLATYSDNQRWEVLRIISITQVHNGHELNEILSVEEIVGYEAPLEAEDAGDDCGDLQHL